MTNGIVYRMSSAGSCAKKLSAIRLNVEGKEAPPWLMTAANEGNWHEDRIVDELKDEGFFISNRQKEVDMNLDSFHLVGHIDGTILVPDNPSYSEMLLEIKTMSQFEFDRWMKGKFEAFPAYAAQITCYMAALHLENCFYIVKNRSSGYTDKAIIEGYPANLEQIIEKLQRVEEYALKGELVSATFDPFSIECKRCEYKDLCIPAPKVTTKQDKEIITKAIARWREGKVLEKKVKVMMNNAKEVLETYAEAQPEKRFIEDEVAVTMVSFIKESYPKEAIVELFGAEALEPALKKTPTSFVKITDMRKE